MLRRPLLAAATTFLLVALVLPSAALALSVHVRVEGAKATLFGAAEPLLEPYTGQIPVDGGQPVDLTDATALGALQTASAQGHLDVMLTSTSFGPYVSKVGPDASAGSTGWVFKVNGVLSPVGADATVVHEGDDVLWYFAAFGESGGPPTLDLVRARPGCYRVWSVDDKGARTRATNVTFRLDGRLIRSTSGTYCPTGKWTTLRARKSGAIRSQVVER